MKKIHTILILSSLLSFNFSFNSHAAFYAGFATCGKYLSAIDNDDYLIWTDQVIWTEGYISAYNALIETGALNYPEKFKIPERDTIKYSLVKYCRDNPQENTVGAAISIMLQIKNSR